MLVLTSLHAGGTTTQKSNNDGIGRASADTDSGPQNRAPPHLSVAASRRVAQGGNVTERAPAIARSPSSQHNSFGCRLVQCLCRRLPPVATATLAWTWMQTRLRIVSGACPRSRWSCLPSPREPWSMQTPGRVTAGRHGDGVVVDHLERGPWTSTIRCSPTSLATRPSTDTGEPHAQAQIVGSVLPTAWL